MVKTTKKIPKKVIIDEDLEEEEEEEENVDDEELEEDAEDEELEEDQDDENVEEEEEEEEEVEEDIDLDDDDADLDEEDEDEDSGNIGIIDLRSEEIDYESISTRVPDNERITENFLTKYELPVVLGVRVQQLLKNAPPLVADTFGKSPMHIAIDELLAKKIPFKIKRQMPYAKYEIWKIKELKINISQDDIEELIKCINM